MNHSIFSVVIILFLFSICVAQDQKNDNGIFVEPKNEFMDEIKDEIQKYEEDEEKPKIMDIMVHKDVLGDLLEKYEGE